MARKEGGDLPGDRGCVHIDRDQRDVQIILKDAIGAVQRAVSLCVQVPVSATKIIRSGGGAGFEEGALKVREPKFFLPGGERCFFDVPEKGVFVGDDRHRDGPEGSQDASGERCSHGFFIQVNMVDLRDVLGSHTVF